MNCEQAQNLFDAYLDQSLTGSLATEFGAHRLGCNRCRRELALLEVAGHVVATDTEAPLIGDEFTDRLVEYAQERPRKQLLRLPSAVLVGFPTALAACIGIIMWLGGGDSPVIPDAQPSPPMVLGETDTVDSREELIANVEAALVLHPDNEALKEFARKLKAKRQEFIGFTRDSASLLEDYSLDALKELVGSVPDSSAEASTSKHANDSTDETTPADNADSADTPSKAPAPTSRGKNLPTEDL